MADLASIANRMAPGLPGSSPPKIAVANGANAAVQLRTAAGAARYYSIKYVANTPAAGQGATIATGDSTVAVPTANDPLFETADGWQDMILSVGATHIRAFGTASGVGVLYVWDRGS